MKVCANCGKELPEDSVFCQYCGSNRVSVVDDFRRTNVNRSNINILNRAETEKKDTGKVYKILFIIALIGMICSICGWAWNFKQAKGWEKRATSCEAYRY